VHATDTAATPALFTFQESSNSTHSKGQTPSSSTFVFGAPHSTSASPQAAAPEPAAPAAATNTSSSCSSSSSSSSSSSGGGHVAGWFDDEAFWGDALLVASNEVGFSEANVRALCDMSASTKKRQAGAFTGEKGAWDSHGNASQAWQYGFVLSGCLSILCCVICRCRQFCCMDGRTAGQLHALQKSDSSV
jgi:hypothetical protein